VDRGTEPTFRSRAVARALAAIIALLGVGLAGFLIAGKTAQITPSQVTPVQLPPAFTPSPSPPALIDLGVDDLASVVTIEAELENGSEESLGSGWIFDNLGDVITNAHVIDGDDTLRVTDRADQTHVARVVQIDALADIAMLRVSGTLAGTPLPIDARPLTAVPLPVITLASSRATAHADMTPETLEQLHVDVPLNGSGIEAGQSEPQEYDDMLYLTGARIYEGNSGGPVLDAAGQVIGIVTLASPSAPNAYAIPISRVLPELRMWVDQG
jgi:serine protease Do